MDRARAGRHGPPARSPAVDDGAIADLAGIALESETSTVSLVSAGFALLETVGRSIEHDLRGGISSDADGRRCAVLDVAPSDGPMREARAAAVSCTELRTCGFYETQTACVSCERETCLATSVQRRR